MNKLQSRCAVITPEPRAPVLIQKFTVDDPQKGSIVVKVEYAGVCGTDPHLWKGDFPLPGNIILGHEGIGIVVAMHQDVSSDHASEPLKIGDRVYWTAIRPCRQCYYCTIAQDECGCPANFFMHQFHDCATQGGTWATYTDYATLGPRNAYFKVDDPSVPPEAFIALGCALPTMLQAVGHLPGGNIPRNETVIVQGAGAIGLAAIMLSKLAGAAQVIVLEANELRMQKAREFGADVCVDIRQSSQEERVTMLAEMAGHKGVGLVIECSGVLSAVQEGLGLLGRNGKYLLVGTWAGKGSVAFDPFVAVNKAITILGSTYCAPRDYYNAMKLVQKAHTSFPLASCVTHKFSLENTQEALETVLAGQAIKAVVQPTAA